MAFFVSLVISHLTILRLSINIVLVAEWFQVVIRLRWNSSEFPLFIDSVNYIMDVFRKAFFLYLAIYQTMIRAEFKY